MIHTVALANIGPFADVTLTFPPARRGGQFLALVGEGKTSALRGAALAIAGEHVGAAHAQYVRYPLLRDGAARATATVRIGDTNYTVTLRSRAISSPIASEYHGVYAAYGTTRVRSPWSGLQEIDSRAGWRRIGSLFDDGDCLLSVRAVVSELQRIELTRREWTYDDYNERGRHYGGAYAGTCAALAGVLGAENVTMGNAHVEVDGVPLPRLGDGQNALAAWVADVCGRWIIREVNAGRTVPVDFAARMDGIVIVDAIDAHLPPLAQATLVERIRAVFPRVTFLAGVEAPLTLCGLRKDEVVVLRREGDVMVGEAAPRSPMLLTATEVCEHFFGVDKLYPSELGDALQVYCMRAANPYRNDADDAAMRRCRALLDANDVAVGFDPEPRAETSA